MFYPAFVCLSVFLQVCLVANSRKTDDQIFMKILPEMYLWTRKSPLNFGRHPDLDADQGVGTNFGVG